MKQILLILTATVLLTTTWASSYRGSDGKLKFEDVTIKVHWADVYNMHPKPRHWSFSEITIIPSSDYNPKGYCSVLYNKKEYSQKYDRIKIKKHHVQKFTLKCNFKSNKNKSIYSINKTFKVERPLDKKKPFRGPLKITIAK